MWTWLTVRCVAVGRQRLGLESVADVGGITKPMIRGHAVPSRFEIDDQLWAEIQPLLPPRPRRRRYPGRKPIPAAWQAQGALAGVGGIGDHIDLPVGVAGGHQADHLVGQHQLGVVSVAWVPQAGQHRQAHVPVRHKRQLDQDADHDPAVAPADAPASRSGRVVVEGGQGQAAACSVEQGVVDGEQDRLVGLRRPTIRSHSSSPRWSGRHRAEVKNRCALAWCQIPASLAPVSMPQTVPGPGWASSPAHKAVKVVKVGAVKQPRKAPSNSAKEPGIVGMSIAGVPRLAGT
jgi:hypothetical protein